MIPELIHRLTESLARRNRQKRYRVDDCPAKVNLGSGLLVAPGWINIDMGWYPPLRHLPRPFLSYLHGRSGWASLISADQYASVLKTQRFIHHDLRLGLPLDDNSVDFLFASHFLDSMIHSDGERLIADTYRVLKPGGALRVSVSDFDRNVDLYRSGRRQEALARFFPNSISPLGRRYCIYDYVMLESALSAAGFVEIARCNYREGRVPDLQWLDNRPEESLFVEAVKR